MNSMSVTDNNKPTVGLLLVCYYIKFQKLVEWERMMRIDQQDNTNQEPTHTNTEPAHTI